MLSNSEGKIERRKRRVVPEDLGGLFDKPRPRTQRTIGYEKVEELLVRSDEQKPADVTH